MFDEFMRTKGGAKPAAFALAAQGLLANKDTYRP